MTVIKVYCFKLVLSLIKYNFIGLVHHHHHHFFYCFLAKEQERIDARRVEKRKGNAPMKGKINKRK